MITHTNLIQGSTEWLNYRLKQFNASEAAAVLGLSKTTTRTELLYIKSTGLSKEFSDYVQRMILDKGHEVEAMARPIVENLIGEDLYPLVCSDGMYSASCDGLTMDESIAFEHKQWNKSYAEMVRAGELPEEHWPQCQQVLMVTGAKKLIFVISDGTENNFESMWVYPDKILQARLVACWEQFAKDLDGYHYVEIIEPPKAEPIKDLPAVIVQVSGALERCNIDEVKPMFDKFLANAITDLVTDEDFAQAEAESKIGRETAKRCIATAKSVVDQTLTISEVTRELENYAAKFNAIALQQEKAVKTQKEARKASAILERKEAFNTHLRALNDEVKPIVISIAEPDWQGATKNQRLLSSLYGKLDDALADGKIRADAVAKDIRVKLAWFNEYVTLTRFLFTDLQTIITGNSLEAFQSIVKGRVTEYTIEQEKKAELERKRIQEEEQRKAEEAQAKKLEAERAAIREEERIKAEAEAKKVRNEEIRIANLVRKEQAEIRLEQELAAKQKSAQQILEEEPITLARVTATMGPVSVKSEQMITITVREHERLLDRDLWLTCLENAGIDNWEGLEFAQDTYSELIAD